MAGIQQLKPAIVSPADRRPRPRPQRVSMPLFAVICGLVAMGVCTLGTWHFDTHSMEGIIALGGEHMVRTGEWFVPKLYGTIYAYKPALAYWLTGLSLHLFGRSEFAMRLPTALCGVALCLATFWIVARLTTPRCGLYAGLAMPACGLFIEHGRIAGFDMPLALGVGLAMLAASRNLVLRRASLGWWLVAYTGLVVGFLAKGLPAIGMFGPGLLAAALALRQLRQLFSWRHLAAVAFAMLVLGAYLYLAYRQEGPAAFQDQYDEINHRSKLWDAEGLARTLLKPVIIWAALLPGSMLMPVLPFLLARSRSRMPRPVRRLTLALACFFLAGIMVWMTVPVGNVRYFLPLVAPVAGLAGVAAEGLSPNPFRRDFARRGAVMAASRPSRARALWVNYAPGLTVAILGLLCATAYAAILQPRRAGARSERCLAVAFAPHLAPGEAVYFDGFDLGSSLFYYLDHPVKRWCLTGWPVTDDFALALNDEQYAELIKRTDLHVELLAHGRTGDGHTWGLARITQNAGSPLASQPAGSAEPSIQRSPPWRRGQDRDARPAARAKESPRSP